MLRSTNCVTIAYILIIFRITYSEPIEINKTLPFLFLNSKNISEVFVKSADSNIAVIHFIKNFKYHIDKKLGEFKIDQKTLEHKLQKNERLIYVDGVSPKLLIQNDSLIIPRRFFLKKRRDIIVRDFSLQDFKLPTTSFIRILDFLTKYYWIFGEEFKRNEIQYFMLETEMLTSIEILFFEQCKLVEELVTQVQLNQ